MATNTLNTPANNINTPDVLLSLSQITLIDQQLRDVSHRTGQIVGTLEKSSAEDGASPSDASLIPSIPGIRISPSDRSLPAHPGA